MVTVCVIVFFTCKTATEVASSTSYISVYLSIGQLIQPTETIRIGCNVLICVSMILNF